MSELKNTFRVIDSLESNIIPYIELPRNDRQAAIGSVVNGSHLLVFGGPGVGKTTLATALARSMDGKESRIQGNAWNTSADVIGHRIYNPENKEFNIIPGPIFSNVVLADEFNRNSGQAQSAFLEAMQEGQVTFPGGETYKLPTIFNVIATQNMEDNTEGIMSVSSAMLDRFGSSIDLSRIYLEDEMPKIFNIANLWEDTGGPSQVVDMDEIMLAKQGIRSIIRNADTDLARHAQSIVYEISKHEDVDINSSNLGGARSALMMLKLGAVLCAFSQRSTMQEEDINNSARSVLGHRTVLKYSAIKKDVKPIDVVGSIVQKLA